MTPFEQALARAREAAAGCVAGDLAEIRVEDRDFVVEVRRTPRPVASVLAPALVSPHAPAKPPVVVRSENVGIVRLSRPVPSVGARVERGRELAFVESLGIRNSVKAPCAGMLLEVLFDDGQAVDFGRSLFTLDATE